MRLFTSTFYIASLFIILVAPVHAGGLLAYQLPAPRVLWISSGTNLGASYLAAACRWRVTVCQTKTNMDVDYHTIDKAVEYTPEMEKVVQKRLDTILQQRLLTLSSYQMVVLECSTGDLSPDQQTQIKNWVAGGGLLVVGKGWYTTAGDTPIGQPLSEILPCVAKQGQGPWFIFFGRAIQNPLVAGVPTWRLHVRDWTQQVAGKPDAIRLTEPLTKPEQDAGYSWWMRPCGKGKVVFNQDGMVMGSSYQTNSLPSYWTEQSGNFQFDPGEDSIDRYQDDGALLADFWRQLSYDAIYGQKAFPALVYLRTSDDPVNAGTTAHVMVHLDLAGLTGQAILQIHLISPTGQNLVEWKRAVAVGSTDLVADLQIPEEYCWPLAQVKAELIDPASGDILHEATDFVEVTSTATLAASPDHYNYLPGSPVQVSTRVTSSRLLSKPMLRMVVHDSRGRVYSIVDAPVTMTMPAPEKSLSGTAVLHWTYPAKGADPNVYLLQGDIWLVSNGIRWAFTRVNLYNGDPWNMRREFVFSPWDFLLHAPDPMVWHGLALEKDAGYNGISGHDMGSQVMAWAEREGWRMYIEGLPGPNIWSPLIDTPVNDLQPKAEAQLAPWIKDNKPDPLRSAAATLVSLGEEPGFKNGWGTRYYWDTPDAPPEAAHVFQSYLKQLYNDNLDDLNKEWGSAYTTWDQVPLSKEYSQGPGAAITLWQSGKGPAVKPDSPYLFSLAPYLETHRFYDWYFNQIDQAAVKAVRQAISPTWKTMFSAGIFHVDTDVPIYGALGPFYPKEGPQFAHANWVANHGDVPGFTGSLWDFFDDEPLLSAELWSALAFGNTYFDSWVDFGLCFNGDYTHTRSSLFKKRWMHAIRPIQKLILDKRYFRDPAIGFYNGSNNETPVTPWNPSSSWDATTVQYSALLESGFRPTIVRPDAFTGRKVIFAPVAEVISPKAADAFRSYVRNGGTLVATMFFAAFSPHGNPLKTAPADGLNDLLGFQVDASKRVDKPESFTIPTGSNPLPANTLILTQRHDVLTNLNPEVKVLARFADGAPAILVHHYGKGLLYYLNFHYDWTHWWNTFYTPDREAYRLLLENILLSVPGVSRQFFVRCLAGRPGGTSGWWKVDFDKDSVGKSNPYWAEELYTDPSGRARYLFVFSDHRSPIIDGRIEWPRAGDTAYDVLTHKIIPWQKTATGTHFIPLTLPPGGGTILAFLPSIPTHIHVQTEQRSVAPGSMLVLHLSIHESKPAQATAHSMNLSVTDEAGNPIEGLSRMVTINGAAVVPLLTALNDPPGLWRITVTDCVTGLSGTTTVRCNTPKFAVTPALLDHWPSEHWPAPVVSGPDFVSLLQRLTQTYRESNDRTELGYYTYIPGDIDSRHNLMDRLSQANWQKCAPDIEKALRAGSTFILTGEDMGLDPRSGLEVSPFDSQDVLKAISELLQQADRVVIPEAEPTVLVGVFGNGRLVLDRTSIDAQGWTNEQITPWHDRWMAALTASTLSDTLPGKNVAPPDPAALRRWLLSDAPEAYWMPDP